MVAEIHPWAVSVQDAFQIQKELTRQLLFEDDTDDPALIAGVDVAFSRARDLLYAAIVVLDAETMQPVEVASAAQQPVFPYVPGLLTFREGPVVLQAYEKLKLDGAPGRASGQAVHRLREVQTRGRVQGTEAEARRDADPQFAQEEGRRRAADQGQYEAAVRVARPQDHGRNCREEGPGGWTGISPARADQAGAPRGGAGQARKIA